MDYPQVFNPYAAIGFNGVNDVSPPEYTDKPFDYVFDVVLSANEALTNQSVPIMTDSDFIWDSVYINTATGAFQVRFSDSCGYYLSNGLINSNNLSTFAGQPYPIIPDWWFPAGGRIGVDITDLSGATNTIQLVFRGKKRFRQS